jgi:hypothetical protein
MMQKWAFVVLVLYILLVVVVCIPALSVILIWSAGGSADVSASDLSIFCSWQFWLYFGTLFLIQAIFLLFPVKVSEAPLKPERLIWVPIVLTGLMFGILVLGIIWSISMAIWGDDALNDYFIWGSLAVVLVGWLIWSWIFYHYSKRIDSLGFSQLTIEWLIKGSILELLIAVPSHIIVRQRKECCAPGVSAYGIAAGLVIMLFAFGPGLYFLFRKRFEAMKPASKRENSQ